MIDIEVSQTETAIQRNWMIDGLLSRKNVRDKKFWLLDNSH